MHDLMEAPSTLLMSRITKGKDRRPPRIVLYGTPGIGKSTFAASLPKPIFIQTEDGLGEIDCAKFPIALNYQDVCSQLKSLATEEHDYETVVIDTLDWLERMIWEVVCEQFGVSNIEKADGGFHKGYTHALTWWQEIIRLLNVLRNRGMIVLLLAHAKSERFEDPENPSYDRYTPKLHKLAWPLFVEWSDVVLFATLKKSIQKLKDKKGDRTVANAVGHDGGERIIKAVGGPACIAKNRYNLPVELPLNWQEIIIAMQ